MSATVQFLTNEKGRKTAVVLPIDDYEKLLEDMDDLSVIAGRRDEETISHCKVRRVTAAHRQNRRRACPHFLETKGV